MKRGPRFQSDQLCVGALGEKKSMTLSEPLFLYVKQYKFCLPHGFLLQRNEGGKTKGITTFTNMSSCQTQLIAEAIILLSFLRTKYRVGLGNRMLSIRGQIMTVLRHLVYLSPFISLAHSPNIFFNAHHMPTIILGVRKTIIKKTDNNPSGEDKQPLRRSDYIHWICCSIGLGI